MYGVELYAAVRLAVVEEGLSHHEAGRPFGIDRRTVKKVLSYSSPPRRHIIPPPLTPKNVVHYYDLSSTFYERFLDEDM